MDKEKIGHVFDWNNGAGRHVILADGNSSFWKCLIYGPVLKEGEEEAIEIAIEPKGWFTNKSVNGHCDKFKLIGTNYVLK